MLTGRERERYERQVLYGPLGEDGQERLRAGTVAIAGVGALGTVAANLLARAGVGRLILIDRDVVELSNLQRQVLYDEADVASGRPKAELAAEKLRAANSDIEVTARVGAIADDTALELVAGADLIVDGVDNFRAKFALNAAALEIGIPYLYGAIAGTYGLRMAVIPGQTACLGCVYREEPDAASSETAATAGVLSPIVNTIASLQVTDAIKLLIGVQDEVITDLLQVEIWDGELNKVPAPRRLDCAYCSGRGP